MQKSLSDKKRYHLVLPDELFTEVQNVANLKATTVVSLLKRFIRLGLLALKAETTEGSALVFIEGKRQRRILFTNEDLFLLDQPVDESQKKAVEVL